MTRRGAAPPDPSADRARAVSLTPVTAACLKRLDIFVALLLKWQASINLIAPSTIPTVWTRHIADSLQLLDLAPDAKIWVDLGSGGGFPGIPIACALADQPGAHVHLVESNEKKAAFLREAIRATNVPASVHVERIENYGESYAAPVDVVCARALAGLKTLCEHAYPFIRQGALGLFLKGQDVASELTDTAKCWNIEATSVTSRTNPESAIVMVRRLTGKVKNI